jgi:hypothetical protein
LIRNGSSTDFANYEDLQKMYSMPNEQIDENRISELRINLIKQWQQNLSQYKIEPAEEPRISEMPSSHIEFVKENAVFEEIFHYFPSLRDAWNDFKDLDACYSAERRKLFGKIKEYIEQKLKEHSLNLESEAKKGFIYSVYSETILKAKDKNGGDYSEDDISVGGVIKRRLNIKYEKFGMVFSIVVEQERIEEVKGIHKEIIEKCKKLYLVSINEVIEIERKIIGSNKKLKSALSKITYRIMD